MTGRFWAERTLLLRCGRASVFIFRDTCLQISCKKLAVFLLQCAPFLCYNIIIQSRFLPQAIDARISDILTLLAKIPAAMPLQNLPQTAISQRYTSAILSSTIPAI